jgi:hypothetical protein
MSDISNQLIKDSYNYVLQSDTTTGLVYRIGGTIPVNPTFQSGLTVTGGFTYSGAGEQVGYVMTCDAFGNATWGPVSAATPSSGVTSVTAGSGLSGNVTTGAVTIINTAPDQTVTISGGTGITTGGTYPNFTLVNSAPDRTVTITGGTNIQITGTYPDFGVNFTGTTTGGTVSGEYLPLSGGTVTGGTVFQSGLTANTFYSSGQVGIGTASPNAKAIIEIASTTQGVLFPRMTKVERDAITSPPIGLILFVTDDNEGLYIYKTSGWVQII